MARKKSQIDQEFSKDSAFAMAAGRSTPSSIVSVTVTGAYSALIVRIKPNNARIVENILLFIFYYLIFYLTLNPIAPHPL